MKQLFRYQIEDYPESTFRIEKNLLERAPSLTESQVFLDFVKENGYRPEVHFFREKYNLFPREITLSVLMIDQNGKGTFKKVSFFDYYVEEHTVKDPDSPVAISGCVWNVFDIPKKNTKKYILYYHTGNPEYYYIFQTSEETPIHFFRAYIDGSARKLPVAFVDFRHFLRWLTALTLNDWAEKVISAYDHFVEVDKMVAEGRKGEDK